ncbi:MAG: dTDP-4-dehydrorhamnose reductase [Omnitrophica bacterium]|nr:dTDP-4-dehydrorhamnose reductase [Candidatus Omnitrophota bacterium]
MVEKAKGKKRKKILVTGSSGMLGTAVSRKLAKNYAVIGLDNRADKLSVEHCDIADSKKTLEVIRGVRPAVIIHTAAWTDVDGCETDPGKANRVNITGTENVACGAASLNIPLLYISTDFVFDGKKKSSYTEVDLPNPLNVYAKSKLEGEKRVARLPKYVILRTSWLFGENGTNFVDTILRKVKSGEKLNVVDDQFGSPTYAKDLAQAIAALIGYLIETDSARDIFHVSNKGAVSWFDYAKEILRLAGNTDAALTSIKTKELKAPAKRPAFSVLDNSKFEKAIGFTMRPWQTALAEYIHEKQ